MLAKRAVGSESKSSERSKRGRVGGKEGVTRARMVQVRATGERGKAE